MARHYRYISADSHFESPPEQWTHRVPKQYRDRAPRRIKLANGHDGVLLEGSRLVYGGTSLYGGRPPETFDPTFMDFDKTPGCGSAAQRLREQDQDGIDAEVLFALDVRNSAIRDKAALAAINDEPGWERLAPPLRPLSTDERTQLLARLAATEFANFRSLAGVR